MNSNRNYGLDYLRAAAIMIVLFNHGLLGFYIDPGKVRFEGLTASISAATVLSIEWLFVLSGFLIGAMMIRSFEKADGWLKSARDFWLRRWFRTLPNYFLFVLVNLALVSWGLSKGTFEYSYLFFSQNLYLPEKTPHFFGESWSLALDEWFYFLMPIIIGFLGLIFKSRQHKFITASLLLITLPVVARVLHPLTSDFFQWDAAIRRITLYHLDATGWGVLAACVNRWFPHWWQEHRHFKAFIGVVSTFIGVMLVVAMVHPGSLDRQGYFASHAFSISLMACGTFLLMPWLTQLQFWPNRMTWAVDRISLYSYSIYLVHFPLIFIFRWAFTPDVHTSALTLMMITGAWLCGVFLLSALIFHGVEKPTSDLRERFTQKVDASPFK
jgi:peptidoglycan/LPS O-acetylase OafA/YrhL